ncbi:MAG: ATP phosphoribosyltransferase [Planctomycetota bacterium]|nr:ATP phosphoribosyltransferase [Planctomycetota bacterium]
MINKNNTGKKLALGIPKGSLQDNTVELLQRAGFKISISSRSYFPSMDDPDITAVMFRAQEMSRYVADGVIDVGITGNDWVEENESNVVEVAELVYAKRDLKPVRWVLAVPAESSITEAENLEGGIVATELVNITRKYFADKGIDVKVEFSWGATEVKARLVDAIVDVTETGSSIRANRLRVIDTIMLATPRLIANKKAWADTWKREKIENISLLLQGAISALEKVGLKMNVRRADLQGVLDLLPAEKSPTVSDLADKDWVALEVIVSERLEREMIPQLKRAGATGIITYPLKKVIS